ncbi:hypothetical protein M918_08710 [Clostridium sp. BL8]|nr:hypothetical protein M918_08710 [Clostridium sp. BL8]
MEITREHKEAILSDKSSDELRDISIEKGMKTLGLACKSLVLQGVTTVDELAKIAFLNE